MNKNLIIMVYSPFTQRDYKRYGIDIIKNNGYNAIIIDISPIIAKNVFYNNNFPDLLCIENYIPIFSKKDLEKFFFNHKHNTIIFSTLTFQIKTFFIYKLITKYNIPYCTTGLTSIPTPVLKINFFRKIKLNLFSLNRVLNKLFLKIPFKYLRINSATFIDIICDKANYHRPEHSKDTIIIRSHSSDYDLYKESISSSEQVVNTNKIVFLDNFLPYHPDSLHTGEKNPVSPKSYHFALNSFFSKIEEITNLEIVIAAHPKSNYSENFNPFNNRTIIRNQTPQLVRDSKFVILNFSTSINFAILFKKPLLFFTTNELEINPYYSKQIRLFVDYFDCNLFNIDNSTDFKIQKPEFNKYNNYIHEYIKSSNSPELHTWQIKCDVFNKYMLNN